MKECDGDYEEADRDDCDDCDEEDTCPHSKKKKKHVYDYFDESDCNTGVNLGNFNNFKGNFGGGSII